MKSQFGWCQQVWAAYRGQEGADGPPPRHGAQTDLVSLADMQTTARLAGPMLSQWLKPLQLHQQVAAAGSAPDFNTGTIVEVLLSSCVHLDEVSTSRLESASND